MINKGRWSEFGTRGRMIADYDCCAMHADMLLRGGTIYTMHPTAPRARTLAVANGTILACSDGPLDELEGRGTRVIDLAGRAVVPGFVDAHIHFGHFALGRRQVDLDGAASLEDGLALLREASGRLEAGAWLHGRGWDRNRWGRLPTATELDDAVGQRPAALSSHDGHSLWLSSTALQRVGIRRETPDPPGGVIERDEGGHPTGVLFENAQDLARRRIPEPSHDELRGAIRAALPLAAAAGLTGIHNLEDRRSRNAFEALDAAGELSLRVYHGIARSELREARERGLRTGAGNDRVRTGPVKLFSDGALGSRTAHLLEPYEGRADGYRGVPTMQPGEIADHMRLAADAELDVAVHAIGDAAVRTVLDAFEQTRTTCPALGQRMLRIEHAQLVHPDDVPRFARLGVVASMQPIHATADWRAADAHWGRRARHGYAWRNLLQAGTVLAFGTDAPVERLEPLKNLYAATTRIDPEGQPDGGWYPEQRLTLQEAVRAYTFGSAIAERASSRRGTLAPGKDADFVVLSPDPFGLPVEALLDTRVELTVVGGRLVFGAPA
jgi:predicted amidohydrolase YtcJ